MQPASIHEAEWAQRLEEWRDGIASAAEAATIESHLPNCDECREYLAALDGIDAALSGSLVAPALSSEFDRNLWSRIGAADEIQRALAKQRAQNDMQQSLAALDRRWRRKLALIIPGVLAGIVLAFWVAYLLSSSWLAPMFTLAHQQLGPAMGLLVQTLITSLVGGVAGFLITQWVAPASD